VFAIVSVIALLAIAVGEGGFVDDNRSGSWGVRPWAVLGLGLLVIGAELGLLWVFSLVQA
jgi:hypothetical protein